VRSIGIRLAAGAAAVALLALAGCDLLLGDRVANLPQDKAWQVLPLRAFLTRPTISVDGMQFCRVPQCGFDAVVGRFTARDGEAAALRQTLTDPAKLRQMVVEPRQVGAKPSTQPPKITVAAFATKGWTGSSFAIRGSRRSAYGVVLERPDGDSVTLLLVIADRPEVARRLALAAATG
jgi:hypothetical protein